MVKKIDIWGMWANNADNLRISCHVMAAREREEIGVGWFISNVLILNTRIGQTDKEYRVIEDNYMMSKIFIL